LEVTRHMGSLLADVRPLSTDLFTEGARKA
jgi:hypothetical protein